MSEAYSAVHISGDLGQALATADGVTYLFDCEEVREADTRDIQIFFDAAAEIEELPGFMLERLDAKGILVRLAESTDRATTLHNFLMGMDASLSKGLRTAAISACGRYLRDLGTYHFLRKRILSREHDGQWDSAGAALIAAQDDAFRPALLYSAVADEDLLSLLQSRDEDWWKEDPRQTYYALVPKGALVPAGNPAWREATSLPVVRVGEYQDIIRLDDVLLRFRDLIGAPELEVAHSIARKRALALLEINWAYLPRFLEDTIALYVAALGETPRDCRILTIALAAESLQFIYHHSDWNDPWPLEPRVVREVDSLLKAHFQMVESHLDWIELHHRLTGPGDLIRSRQLRGNARASLEARESSAMASRPPGQDDKIRVPDPISPSLRAMARAAAALVAATPWYVSTAAALGVAIASISPSTILSAISLIARIFQ